MAQRLMPCALMCMQVASYAFTFPNEDGVPTRMLLPLLDMLNHGNEGTANVQIIEADNGDIYAYTLRDVEAGEEVSLRMMARACSSAAELLTFGIQLSISPMLRSCLCRKELLKHAAALQHGNCT